MAKGVTLPPFRVLHICLCSTLQLSHPRWTAKEWLLVKLALKILMSHQSLQYLGIAMLLN